jgi:hypothetical protein
MDSALKEKVIETIPLPTFFSRTNNLLGVLAHIYIHVTNEHKFVRKSENFQEIYTEKTLLVFSLSFYRYCYRIFNPTFDAGKCIKCTSGEIPYYFGQ